MCAEQGRPVSDVAACVAFEAALSLMLGGDVDLQVRRARKPSFADDAAQDRLVGVVMALVLVRLHLTSTRRREVAVVIGAPHLFVRLQESCVSQLCRNFTSQHHVDRDALAGGRVLLGMSAFQMFAVLQARSGMQATLGAAGEVSV